MPKLVPLLIAAVLAGVLLFVLFGPGDGDGGGLDGAFDDDDEAAYEADPALRASGRGTTARDPRGSGATDTGGVPAPDAEVVWLAGTVLDARTRKPVPGASLDLEPASAPCPRMPQQAARPGTLASLDDVTNGLAHAVSGEDGSFRIMRRADTPNPGAYDLFVFKSGYVIGCVCRASGTDIQVHLVPGLVLSGRVLNPVGHPIEGARVEAGPPEGLPRLPGTAAKDTTDREGRFRLDGLKAEALMVHVDHPHFMPLTVGPREPGDPTPFDISVVPAFRVSFHIRTDDGEPVVNPTVRWVTDGDPPAEDLKILRGTPAGPPARQASELKTESLRIPCDRRTVDLEIKAEGYMPWTTRGEPLPADGGERLFPVTIGRDTSVGALRITLQDKEGTLVSYAESRAVANLTWLGPRDQMPSSYVLTATEVLDLPSIRAGPYRVTVRSPVFAPAEVDVEVVAGKRTDAKLTTAPPARLKVRFLAAEAMTVHFRLTQDGRPALAFPEGQETLQPTGDAAEPLVATGGGDTLVLSGLGAGTYVVEVTSEDLEAAPQSVRLTPGQTEEVEIEVQRR